MEHYLQRRTTRANAQTLAKSLSLADIRGHALGCKEAFEQRGLARQHTPEGVAYPEVKAFFHRELEYVDLPDGCEVDAVEGVLSATLADCLLVRFPLTYVGEAAWGEGLLPVIRRMAAILHTYPDKEVEVCEGSELGDWVEVRVPHKGGGEPDIAGYATCLLGEGLNPNTLLVERRFDVLQAMYHERILYLPEWVQAQMTEGHSL